MLFWLVELDAQVRALNRGGVGTLPLLLATKT